MNLLKCGDEYISGTNADGFPVWTYDPDEALQFSDDAVAAIEPFPPNVGNPSSEPTKQIIDVPVVVTWKAGRAYVTSSELAKIPGKVAEQTR